MPIKDKFEDPDPEGDLRLVLGSEPTQSILVSSKVLKLSSPVLSAMLSPRYAEGQSLSKTGVSTLSLPEDDPKAMAWVCHSLHYNHGVASRITKLSLLGNIARLCDKYDMGQALCLWSEEWMRKWISETAKKVPDRRTLWMSYAFSNHRTFYQVSREMIISSPKSVTLELGGDDTKGILPIRVRGK